MLPFFISLFIFYSQVQKETLFKILNSSTIKEASSTLKCSPLNIEHILAYIPYSNSQQSSLCKTSNNTLDFTSLTSFNRMYISILPEEFRVALLSQNYI